MKRRVQFLVIVTIVVFTSFFVVSCITNDNGQELDGEEKYEEEKYLTKEEVVELFYNNFDAFDKLADYLMNSTGYFTIQRMNSDIHVKNQGVVLDIDDMVLGEQIKHIVCDLGFLSISKDELDTRIEINIPYGEGIQGLVYTNEEVGENRFYSSLEKENWYYQFYIHSPPGGGK